jgi:hypothetical protein
MFAITLALLCQLPPAMPPLPEPVALRVAADEAATLAPAAVARPAGVLTSLPRHHLSSPQCAGGACGVQPAAARRYAAPVRQRRVFSGRIFGRR